MIVSDHNINFGFECTYRENYFSCLGFVNLPFSSAEQLL